MKILITGATGLVGSELSQVLHEKGHELILISRGSVSSGESQEPRMKWIKGDLSLHPLKELKDIKFDAVFHLIGDSLSDGRWTEKKKMKIRQSRVASTQNLIASLNIAPALFVSASAVGIFGDRGNEILTEGSSPGNDFLSSVCQEWEAAASVMMEKCRTVVARFGVVLHPHRGAFPLMSKPFRYGAGAVLGSGQQWMSWIYYKDLVSLLEKTIHEPRMEGVCNFVAPNPIQNSEWSHLLAEVLHRPLILSVPQVALKFILGEMSQVLLSSQRVHPTKLMDLAGTTPSSEYWKVPNAVQALREMISTPE